MRALSVRQPWAELIAQGKKKIEYRSWKRDFRGDLLIVASASRHDDECADERLDPDKLTYGAAVCVVDLWKVTGDEGDYSWHVRNPRRVEPVAVKGFASIYHVDDAVIRFAKSSPRAADVRAKPKKTAAVASVVGAPSVLIAARDPRLTRRWQQALRDMGCRVTALRDGFGAWRHLDSHPAACVLLDADVEGYSAGEVLARMRESKAHADTPVIFAGAAPAARDGNVSRVARAASAEAVAKAVERALTQ